MFLFEKSLIGVCCNRLHDLKERHDAFSCYGQIKANNAGKNLTVTNIDTKVSSPNHHIGHQQTAHFFMNQNDHHFSYTINFDVLFSLHF